MHGWVVFVVVALWGAPAFAQDVPGIEICTVDKTMERRTSCLQSNVDFLLKTISRLRSDNDQKLDAANRQIAAQGNAIVALQKAVADLQSAKPVEPVKGAVAPATTGPAPAKDAAPAAK